MITGDYSEYGPTGLNPDSWYAIFPGESPNGPFDFIEARKLPPSAVSRFESNYSWIFLSGQAQGIIKWKLNDPNFF